MPDRLSNDRYSNRRYVGHWLIVVAAVLVSASFPPAVSKAQDTPGKDSVPRDSDPGKTVGTTADSNGSPAKKGKTGTTFVSADTILDGVLTGQAPASIEQLQQMEALQREVAKRAAECTVSVQIGRSQGCGVIITGDGYVLTAAHVAMRTQKTAFLTLNSGRRVRARTLGLNREVDAGLIKIESDVTPDGKPWPHATLGTSKGLKTGMWCMAMGHPGGYDSDRGVVARVGRILAVRRSAIVTDCALIGGDSGGPLFNLQGELIGVHSRIGNDVADNLHVPVDHYDTTWERLARGEAWGFLPGFRPRIGVSSSDRTDVAEIRTVYPGSPAEAAGIKAGDIVERFGEATIGSFEELQAAVNETMPGEQVDVTLRRENQVLRVLLEVGRDPNF